MLRTISVGSHVQIQGLLVKTLEDGKLVISVGGHMYAGKPVN